MLNNFGRFIKGFIGLKLWMAILCVIVLPIITIYQLVISLFIPCFYNILILLILYLLLIGFWFFILFC